jgi:hypothetical protein
MYITCQRSGQCRAYVNTVMNTTLTVPTVVTTDNDWKVFSYWMRAVLRFRRITLPPSPGWKRTLRVPQKVGKFLYWVPSDVSLRMAPSTKRPGRCSLTTRYKGHNKSDSMPFASPWRTQLHERSNVSTSLRNSVTEMYTDTVRVRPAITWRVCRDLCSVQPWPHLITVSLLAK